MKKIFEQLTAILIGENRLDIRRRMMRLVLSASILTFLVPATISNASMFLTWLTLDIRGQQLGESAANYTGTIAEQQAKIKLAKNNQLRAEFLNSELQNVCNDTEFFAHRMTDILTHPENYRPRTLPNALFSSVESREPYVHYGPALADRGVSEEVNREIELASNIADTLNTLKEYYPCAFVGSKNGYVLKIDVMPPNEIITSLSREPKRNSYEARERLWYSVGENASRPIFTDVYIAAMTGEPCISCTMRYEDADGFAGVVGIDCNAAEIYAQLNKTALGNNEFCFILNSSGEILYSTQRRGDFVTGEKNFEANDDPDVANLISEMLDADSGVLQIKSDGEEYYAAYAPMPAADWSIATLVRRDEVIAPARNVRDDILLRIGEFEKQFGQLFVFMFAIGLTLMLFLIYSLFRVSDGMARRFVEPIEELAKGVREITSGNFDRRIDIKTGDEIEHLAVCFNAMLDELKTYMKNLTSVTAEKERIATELDVATEIQQSILPQEFDFNRADFEIFATMNAAKEVGGDFYDFYMLDENHLMITMADVSGKGVPAALFMMIGKTVLKNSSLTAADADDIGALVTRANQQLCQNNDAMMFITTFIGLLDLKSGRFTYVNGGHNPPLIYSARDEKWRYLGTTKHNYALGLIDDAEFEQETIDLASGDMIYLYTDGVTEALNEREELYGDDRLEQCLNRVNVKNLSVEEVLEEVRRSLDEYVGNTAQSDDITMLAVRLSSKRRLISRRAI